MKENKFVYDCMIVDKEENTFMIIDGSVGTYAISEIKKVDILGEDAKWKGKSEVFSHLVITGIGVVSSPLFEPSFYLGLKIHMKNGDVLAAYISEKPVRMNTDHYFTDKKVAEEIKDLLVSKKVITKKERNLKKINEKNNKFRILHKDLSEYWFGKTFFLILCIGLFLVCSYFHEDIKDWVTMKDPNPTIREIFISSYEDFDSFTYMKIRNGETFEEFEVTADNKETNESYKEFMSHLDNIKDYLYSCIYSTRFDGYRDHYIFESKGKYDDLTAAEYKYYIENDLHNEQFKGELLIDNNDYLCGINFDYLEEDGYSLSYYILEYKK